MSKTKEEILAKLPALITQLLKLEYFTNNLLLYLNKDVQEDGIFYQEQTADRYECLLDAIASFRAGFEPINKDILEYEEPEYTED